MARQSQETRLLREAAYCLHKGKDIPEGLWKEMQARGLDTRAAVRESVNIEHEVFFNESN